ncbi:MAG: alpha/beta fold hydrolase, partial [Steroidobacteraceae bacterium]
ARLRADPRHKLPFPTVYRMEEIEAIWGDIRAPVLWVAAAGSPIPRWLAGGDATPGAAEAEVARRMRHVPQATLVTVADAGHMLHHDQPEAVARIVEEFVGDVIVHS